MMLVFQSPNPFVHTFSMNLESVYHVLRDTERSAYLVEQIGQYIIDYSAYRTQKRAVLVEDGENRHKLCPIKVDQNSLQGHCSFLPVMGYDVKYSSKSRAGNSLPFRGHDDGQELYLKKKKPLGSSLF